MTAGAILGARLGAVACMQALFAFATRGSGAPDPASLKAAAEAGRTQGQAEAFRPC
jgi:hypothetical protein